MDTPDLSHATEAITEVFLTNMTFETPGDVEDVARVAAAEAAPQIGAAYLRAHANAINVDRWGPAVAPYLSAIKAELRAAADKIEEGDK